MSNSCYLFSPRLERPKSKATRREPIPRQLVKLPGDWSQVYLCDFSQTKRTASKGSLRSVKKQFWKKHSKFFFDCPWLQLTRSPSVR